MFEYTREPKTAPALDPAQEGACMPLTKPRRRDCDYNLSGMEFGTRCPECGLSDRKLLTDGTSRLLTWSAVVLLVLMSLSVVSILVNFAHFWLFPQAKGDWAGEMTRTLRVGLRPSLVASSLAAFVASFFVVLWDSLHHTSTMVRLLQVALCVLLSALAVGLAASWG